MIDPDDGAVTLDKAMESGLLGYPDIVGKQVKIGGREGLWTVVSVGPIGMLVESIVYENRENPARLDMMLSPDPHGFHRGIRHLQCRPGSIRRALIPWGVAIDWTEAAPESEWEDILDE